LFTISFSDLYLLKFLHQIHLAYLPLSFSLNKTEDFMLNFSTLLQKFFRLLIVLSFITPAWASSNQSTSSFDKLLNDAKSLSSSDPDSSIALTQKALTLAPDSAKMQIHAQLGYLYAAKEDYHRSNYHYQRVLEHPTLATKPDLAASIHNNMGINFELLDAYDLAIKAYLSSIRVEEAKNNPSGKYTTWINLGLLYHKMKDFNKARDYTQEALAYFKQQEDSLNIALCHQNLGIIYTYKLIPDSSRYFNDLALRYFWNNQLFYNYLQTAFNISSGHLHHKEIHLARHYLSQAQQLDSIIQKTAIFLGMFHLQTGQLNMLQNNSSLAQLSLDKAYAIFDSIGANAYTLEALDLSMKNLVPPGKLDIFEQYMDKFRAQQNNIFSKNVASSVSQAEIGFEVESLKKDLRIKAQQAYYQQKISYGLLAFCLLLILGSGLISWLWQQQKANNKSLFKLNRELSKKIKFGNSHKDPEQDALFEAIKQVMEKEMLFLQHDLSLDLLVQKVGSNRKYVSQSINIGSGSNVNNFINEYRITYATKLMEENPNYPMETIADTAGFNSRATFFRAFKSVTGLSPGEYQHQLVNLQFQNLPNKKAAAN
jgi:AraC-like DNA-binding protein/Tfp pilus assembly protein PilF